MSERRSCSVLAAPRHRTAAWPRGASGQLSVVARPDWLPCRRAGARRPRASRRRRPASDLTGRRPAHPMLAQAARHLAAATTARSARRVWGRCKHAASEGARRRAWSPSGDPRARPKTRRRLRRHPAPRGVPGRARGTAGQARRRPPPQEVAPGRRATRLALKGPCYLLKVVAPGARDRKAAKRRLDEPSIERPPPRPSMPATRPPPRPPTACVRPRSALATEASKAVVKAQPCRSGRPLREPMTIALQLDASPATRGAPSTSSEGEHVDAKRGQRRSSRRPLDARRSAGEKSARGRTSDLRGCSGQRTERGQEGRGARDGAAELDTVWRSPPRPSRRGGSPW